MGRRGAVGFYQAERKPVAWRNGVVSASNSDKIDAVTDETPVHIADATHIVPDHSPEPPDDPMQLVPGTWPGMRAPRLPVRTQCMPSHVAEAFERPLVLVRPDGHVAWHGFAPPGDLREVAARIRG